MRSNLKQSAGMQKLSLLVGDFLARQIVQTGFHGPGREDPYVGVLGTSDTKETPDLPAQVMSAASQYSAPFFWRPALDPAH